MSDKFPIELLRPSFLKILKKNNPDLLEKKFISYEELEKIRKAYFINAIGKLEEDDTFKDEIVDSLLTNSFLTDNVNSKVKTITTYGDKVSSLVSDFLGSWKFIILIFLLVSFWLFINSIGNSQFDPFPFAILGLFLTALSALQAPFILNTQKKQSKRDRLKFDEDYQTNLKSELEIRNLHSKIDHYNKIIWEKLEKIEKSQNYKN